MSTVLLDHLKTVGNSRSPALVRAELARSVDLLTKQFYGVLVFPGSKHTQPWMFLCQDAYAAIERSAEKAVYHLCESRQFHREAASLLALSGKDGVRAEGPASAAAKYAADWPREQASKKMLLQLGLAEIRLKWQLERLGEPLSRYEADINMNNRRKALEKSLEEPQPQLPLAQPNMREGIDGEAAGSDLSIAREGESEWQSASQLETCSQYSYRRRSRP